MSIQRTKFAPPFQTSRKSQIQRTILTTPYVGMNTAQPPREITNGESPFIRDFRVTDLGLSPRSVNSKIGFVGIGDAVQHLAQHEEFLIGVSSDSLLWTNDIGSLFSMSWSSGGIDMPDMSVAASGSTQRFDTVSAKDQVFGNTMYITGVDQMVPQFLPLDNVSSHSTLTDWLASGESFAYSCAAVDDRLVMFGSIDSLGTQNPTRVKWSVRGDPDNFTGNGANFEDLIEMDGTASRIVNTRDRLILFTERAVWEATSRRDAFAFDFRPIFEGIGLAASRALVNTPFGIFWYGSDKKLHRLLGNRITLIGRKIWSFYEGGINDIVFHPDIDNDGYLTLNDVETNKHVIITGSLLTIDDATGVDLFIDDGTGKFLVDDQGLSGTDDPDFARNTFMTYNPVEQELVLWFGVTGAGKQAATAVALRLDTLEPTGQDEEDGIWTTYLHDQNNAILSATPFVDGNSVNHMLYGSNVNPNAESGEIWEWTNDQTTEFVGTSVRTLGTDWTPVWHSGVIRPSDDPFAYESHTGVWMSVDLPEHDQTNVIEASVGSQVWNLASPSPGLAVSSLGTVQVGGAEADAAGRVGSPTVAFIPTSTKAEPETSLRLSVTSGRPTINHVELLSRSFSGKFGG